MSLGILNMYASPEAVKAANIEVSDRRYYIDAKQPADCVLEIVEVVTGEFDAKNKTNRDAGQPWLTVRLQLVEGTVGLSERKAGGGYSNFPGQPGDSVSLFFNLSAKQPQDAIERAFRDLQNTTATLCGFRAADYDPEGARAGQILADLQAIPEGQQVRLTQTEPNAKGYYNDRTMELIPMATSPAKAKSKKAS